MNNTIENIFKEFNFNEVSINQPIEDIVQKTEKILLSNNYTLEMSRKLMAKLWKYQQELQIDQLINTNKFKQILSEILEDKTFSIKDRFLISNKFIFCTSVKTEQQFQILNDNQIQKLIQLGYGITQYKLQLNTMFTDIYCRGKHPNLNLHSDSFCVDSNIKGIEVNKKNLEFVEEMISQINLTSTFLEPKERNDIMEAIK